MMTCGLRSASSRSRAAQRRDLVSLHVHLHEIRHEAAGAVCELVEAGLWSNALLGHLDPVNERRVGGDVTAQPLARARIRLHREHAGAPRLAKTRA